MLPRIERQPTPLVVQAGRDRFGEERGLGVSQVDFKLASVDATSMFALENRFTTKGGPARHVHPDQDEWFFVLEGAFEFEVGGERVQLAPGDSIFGPRGVPHVWAHVDDGPGRILIVFTQAGHMEAFFREVTQNNAMPMQDPALWRRYGMELVGPPLPLS